MMNGFVGISNMGMSAVSSQEFSLYEGNFFTVARGWPMADASNLKELEPTLRVGDTVNFDDNFLSPIEIVDIMASREEHAAGRSKVFDNADEAIAWLHSE